MVKEILMLCHDQHLDRRVVAQATSLIKNGFSVKLLALAFDSETSYEKTPENIDVIRIGLSHIIPENPTYKSYIKRQLRLNAILNKLCNNFPKSARYFSKGFKVSSAVNWNMYRVILLLRYRNRHIHDPLPFRQAFVSHGEKCQFDVIQVHDLPALEAGVELAKKFDVPLVYDAHELYPEQRSFSGVQRKICEKSESTYIKHANVVFAVNESIAQEMAMRYGIKKPIVITNAMNPPVDFDPVFHYNLLREKLNISHTRRILLLQGGFAPNRNLNELVRAMAKVKNPDVDLVMMGFGEYGLKLKKTAESLGLIDKRVYFLPAVDQSVLLQHSASADMGIIPYPHVDLNSYYCTPNKLFEYIQACLPIIANDSPELKRFVWDQGFGLIHKMKNTQEIANAIDLAFAQLSSSGWRERQLMMKHQYTWAIEEKKYISAIKTVFGK